MLTPGLYWMVEPELITGESTSEKKTPYLAIKGRLTHERTPDGVNLPLSSPPERTIFLYLSSDAFAYTVERLEPLGFNGDFASPRLDDQHMRGLWAECTYELYDGKNRERWNVPGGGRSFTPKAAGTDTIRRLNAMYRNRAGGPGLPATKRLPVAAAADPPPFDPGRIPDPDESPAVGEPGPRFDENGLPF